MRALFWLACLALIFALALPGCATPTKGAAVSNSDGTLTITVSAARAADCRANGGCGLFSRKELLEMAETAIEFGMQQTCPAKNREIL